MPRPVSKPMVSKELRLIDLIRQNPELYDANHVLAKDVTHKKLVWENISTELNTSVDSLKKLWKKLRYNYAKRSRESDAGKTIPSTPYDEALAFLITSVLEYSNGNSCANSNASSPKAGEERSLRSSRAHLTAISEEDKLAATNNINAVAAQEEPPQSSQTEVCTPPQGSTRSGSSETTDREGLRKAVNSASRRLSMTPSMRNRNKKSLNPDDSTRAFFDSMALTVASFPQYVQATIKIHICTIVAETEYELSSPKIC